MKTLTNQHDYMGIAGRQLHDAGPEEVAPPKRCRTHDDDNDAMTNQDAEPSYWFKKNSSYLEWSMLYHDISEDIT